MNEGRRRRESPEIHRETTIVRKVAVGASIPVLAIAIAVGYAGGGEGGAAAAGVVGAVCVFIGITISPRLYERLAKRGVFSGMGRRY